MSNHQFGVWMDERKATIVVKDTNSEDMSIVAHVKNEAGDSNSNENTKNNQERTETRKYFKEICTHMQNATSIHLTGTGTIQEAFMSYLDETPQFKNATTSDSTSNKMSDEKLVEFMANKF